MLKEGQAGQERLIEVAGMIVNYTSTIETEEEAEDVLQLFLNSVRGLIFILSGKLGLYGCDVSHGGVFESQCVALALPLVPIMSRCEHYRQKRAEYLQTYDATVKHHPKLMKGSAFLKRTTSQSTESWSLATTVEIGQWLTFLGECKPPILRKETVAELETGLEQLIPRVVVFFLLHRSPQHPRTSQL